MMITGGNGGGSGAAWSTDALVLLTRFRALLPCCSTPGASHLSSTNSGTRGTELTENGQRLDSVQRVVGHKDPRSTQLYVDMAEYQVRQVLERR